MLRKGATGLALAIVLAGGAFLVDTYAPRAPYAEARTIARGATGFKDLTARFSALAKEKKLDYVYNTLTNPGL